MIAATAALATTTTTTAVYADHCPQGGCGSTGGNGGIAISIFGNPANNEEGVRQIESAEPSSNSAHRGEITKSLTIDPESGEEDDDTPALHRERTKSLPNDRIIFRVVESAPQSSNAEIDDNADVQLSVSQSNEAG